MKRLASQLIGIIVSAGLLYFVFKDIKFAELAAEFRKINWAYTPLLLVLLLLSIYLRALRWKLLLPSQLQLSYMKLSQAVALGFFATMVLPLRAGEFVRPLALSRLEPVSFSAGFASIVVERVFDVLSLVLLLSLTLAHVEAAPTWTEDVARGLMVLSFGIIAVMVFSYLNGSLVLRLFSGAVDKIAGTRKPALAAALKGMAAEFLRGLCAISSLKELLLAIFWSLMVWLDAVLFYQAGLWAMGEFPSYWAGCAVTVMIALAVAAPSAPGFIGTFQAGCLVALENLYHYPKNFAAAYSVFVHVLQASSLILLGVYILSSLGLSLKTLQSGADKT